MGSGIHTSKRPSLSHWGARKNRDPGHTPRMAVTY